VLCAVSSYLRFAKTRVGFVLPKRGAAGAALKSLAFPL